MRHYAIKHLITTDVRLMEDFDILYEMQDVNFDATLRQKYNKRVTDFIRSELGINNVIGLAMNRDRSSLQITIFNAESKEGSYYNVNYDKQLDCHYVELQEGVKND